MRATPIDDLRKPHPDQQRIDAEAALLLLATAPAGYAKKRGKAVALRALLAEDSTQDVLFPKRR